MKKLSSHGIDGEVKNWIECWLSGRVQRVGLNGTVSSWKPVASGVPQGSVLGPVLFLIYINDLEEDVSNWLLKFADDTKLFGEVNNSLDAGIMQADLDRMCQWSREWQMMFNVEKCKVMHIGKRSTKQDYKMNGKILEAVEKEKDLGILISHDLKVSLQCRQACNKANRMLGVINRTITYKNKKILLNLYKSLVRPHLEFSVVAWSPHYCKDKDLVEKVQHRFTRMIPELKNKPYEDRLEQLKLWTLEERRNRADLVEVYKMNNGLTQIPFKSFLRLMHLVVQGVIG